MHEVASGSLEWGYAALNGDQTNGKLAGAALQGAVAHSQRLIVTR